MTKAPTKNIRARTKRESLIPILKTEIKGHKFIDLTGKKFGRLKVLGIAGKAKKNNCIFWDCLCSCGTQVIIKSSSLKVGKTKSCSCLSIEQFRERTRTHGLSDTTEHNIWMSIRDRINNPKNYAFKYYGGRGIKLCKRWNSFRLFLKDMGLRPSKNHSLDRKNVNGNYSPSNCRWVDMETQNNNKRSNIKLKFNGLELSVSQWERKLGVKDGRIRDRLIKGWSIEKALTTPTKRHIKHFIQTEINPCIWNGRFNITTYAKKNQL